jgi:hypothetical protein
MLDFKKTQKDFYRPATTPAIIDIPEMLFIAADGRGNPNTSPEYAAAVQLLYALSYSIKMNNKAILEYVVPPLEGLWALDDPDFKGGGLPITDKDKFIWTMMIRQPEFVTPEIFEAAKAAVAKKKPDLDITKARLKRFTEGLCVQIMHIGPYDDEPQTIAIMEKFAIEQGYKIDMAVGRRHHEIYISDPRKTAPARLKTIIRHPINSFIGKGG